MGAANQMTLQVIILDEDNSTHVQRTCSPGGYTLVIATLNLPSYLASITLELSSALFHDPTKTPKIDHNIILSSRGKLAL